MSTPTHGLRTLPTYPHPSAVRCGRLMCCEPTGQEGDRPHDCRPIYSRSVCGQCGGQEQWCETCSRQMCGCATDGQEGDHA